MTRRDWWLGIVLVTAALLTSALTPRYEWRGTNGRLVRIDRWTGAAVNGQWYDGRWVAAGSPAPYYTRGTTSSTSAQPAEIEPE